MGLANAIFTGPTPDKFKMILGLVTYILFFSGNHAYLPWIWIPMDFVIVGGAIHTGNTSTAFSWKKRFSVPKWFNTMMTHGVGGTINMISGHIAWFFPSQSWALYLHLATVPVMCYTAWHMGTVAMGTFRVDIVYKIGAVFWAWPAITFLLWPDSSIDHTLKMLGYSQAFCFVRIASPTSFLTLKLIRAAGGTVTKHMQERRWDVAASCGILTGMLLGLQAHESIFLMPTTMLIAFGLAPLCIKQDGRIQAGADGSKTPRWQ